MKKQVINPLIIFSVFKDGLNIDSNTENHNKVKTYLAAHDISFKEAVKGYKDTTKISILVADSEINREITLDIIRSFDETDRLFRDKDGLVTIERLGENTKTIDLGYLLQVTKSYAESKQNWLLDTDSKQYYALVETPESLLKGLTLAIR